MTDPVRLLAAFDVCAISDALDALGIAGQVLDGLGPIWEGATVVGRVVTTQLEEGPAPAGSPPVHLGARAIESCAPGDVIVIANGGRDGMGSWGGLLSMAAALAGVAGVVTDGAARDVDEAREMGFPVFARAGAVRTARGRVHEVSTGEPVTIGGVTIRPGDIAAADGSGVVVIPSDRADAVAERAALIVRREQAMQERLRAGDRVSSVLGASYEQLLQ